MNMHNPSGVSEAIALLKLIDPTGRHHLTALDPEERQAPRARSFSPGAWDEMAEWLRAHAGQWNLYFSVNEPREGAPNDKLKKTDIAKIRCIFVDSDPKGDDREAARRELAERADEIASGDLPATVSIDSGNGQQWFWRLAEKLDTAEHQTWAENQGRALAHALKGDAVQNIDRIMRLPGLVNLPTPKKRAKGLVGGLARITHKQDVAYTPEALSSYCSPRASAERQEQDALVRQAWKEINFEEAIGYDSLDALPAGLKAKLRAVADRAPEFKALLQGDLSAAPADPSGSGWRAKLASEMGSYLFSGQEFANVACAWPPGYPTGRGFEGLNRRTLARDWGRRGLTSPIRRLMESVSLSDPEPLFPDPASVPAPAKPKKRFEIITLDEAAETALDITKEPLIKGLLSVGALSVVYGRSGQGKTFVTMDMAYHVAAGLPYGGMKTRQRSVLYIAAEGGDGARKRARALREKYGPCPGFHLLLAPVDLLHDDADLTPLIEQILEDYPDVGLIIIDTLSRAMAGGDENSSVDMGKLVKHFDALRVRTGAHVMVVHHSGKDQERGARGHSLLRAALDTEIEVADGEVTVQKQRDMDQSWSVNFRLETVLLGHDKEGDPVTSCVVKFVEGAKVVVGVPPSAREEEVLQVMDLVLATKPDREVGVKVAELATACGERLPKDVLRTLLHRMLGKGYVTKTLSGGWVRVAAQQNSGVDAAPNEADIFA